MLSEVWLFFVLSVTCVLSGKVRQFQTFNIKSSAWEYPSNTQWNLLHSGDSHRHRRSNNFNRDAPSIYVRDKREASNEEERDVENYRSDLEEPRDIPTRPDYRNKGHWANGYLPSGKTVDVGFVPEKIYTQVRRYDTVKHLPRSAASNDATTYEELVNAPRLREVLSHKKIQQVYEEEGYEDSGYDHGGYDHHGAKYQDSEKNDDLSARKNTEDSYSGSAAHVIPVVRAPSDNRNSSSSKPSGVRKKRYQTESVLKEMKWDDEGNPGAFNSSDDIPDNTGHNSQQFSESEPDGEANSEIVKGIDRGETVRNLTDKSTIAAQDKLDVDNLFSVENTTEIVDKQEVIETAESHSAVREEPEGRSLEPRVVNDPRPKGSGAVTFPGRHTRRQYAAGRPLDVYVQESVGLGVRRPLYSVPMSTNVHHYLPYLPQFPSYYSDNPASYASQLIAQRVPVTQAVISPQPTPPPTYPPPSTSPLTNTGPVKFVTAADTLNAYANLLQQAVSANKPESNAESQHYADIIQPRFNSSVDLGPSSRQEKLNNGSNPRRRPSKFRYPLANVRGKQYNNFTRVSANYSNERGAYPKPTLERKNPSPHTRHPSLPRDSTEQEDNHSNRHPINPNALRPIDPVKYVEQLTVAHFANVAHMPASPPSVQNERLKELARQLNAHSINLSGKEISHIKRKRRHIANIEYDNEKYPFYDSSQGVHKNSALRYASNPNDVPKKSPGGMEFYESRDKLINCQEPQPPEDIIPEKDEDGEWNERTQPESTPRIKGIGNSIDCLKVKYFGEEPLDNPFFKEGVVVEPEMDEWNKIVKAHIMHSRRKTRSTVDANDRLMIIPSRQDNSSNVFYNNHNYTNSEVLRTSPSVRDYSTLFPYTNHKPESAIVSQPVHNLRVTSPYKYYSEGDDSYLPKEESGTDNETEDSKRQKYYHSGHYKHKYIRKKKKRYRPSQSYNRRYPVSIYSVIGASNNYPVYRRPIVYSSSSHLNRIIPVYQYDTRPLSDTHGSDSKDNYQTAPTRWYIVRPGEYTENKDIASDNKPASSIWNYINPLRWWFPSYFDQRRGEPKHRRRRSSEQELFNRILARTNNATQVEPRVFESSKTTSQDTVRNHKQETTTGAPLSINEFKAKFNISNGKQQSRLNRLTGGFIARSTYTTTTPSYSHTAQTPAIMLNEGLYGSHFSSSTPLAMQRSSVIAHPTTSKPKVSFPRTKTPPKRRPTPTKKNFNSDSRNILTTTTTTSTTSTTQPTTTRMYKPKRLIKKKFDSHLPVDAFTVLRRSKQPTSTIMPYDSMERESGSIEEPRRVQQVEHRRVTKEEVYKTSYVPQDDASMERNSDISMEHYSVTNSGSNPPMENTTPSDNHTLTYMMNPVTGVGSWGEHPRRTTWKPKKRFPKRHLEDKPTYKSIYSYPTTSLKDAIEQESITRRNRKRNSDESPYENEAYIAGLMSRVQPASSEPRPARLGNPFRSLESIEGDVHKFSAEDIRSYEDGQSEENISGSSGESYPLPPPTKSPPKFIMDPGRRKYFYVKNR